MTTLRTTPLGCQRRLMTLCSNLKLTERPTSKAQHTSATESLLLHFKQLRREIVKRYCKIERLQRGERCFGSRLRLPWRRLYSWSSRRSLDLYVRHALKFPSAYRGKYVLFSVAMHPIRSLNKWRRKHNQGDVPRRECRKDTRSPTLFV
jgi:hypothetical protein